MGTERVSDEELKAALEVVFRANREVYAGRGFQRRIGFGERPALVLIDLANGWTRPGHAFSCAGMDEVIAANQSLLEAFRAKGLPIVYTTTAYQVPEGPGADTAAWGAKIPLSELRVGSEAAEIDSRIAPREGELVITKKMASGFHGTNLASWLTAQKVDTIVVTGVTASACVRHTLEDGIANGFRTICPREAVGDRIAGAVEWNLFDIDAKFGDVMPVEEVLDHMRRND
ncbi:isochorismatase family protein [Acuticoccus mangrovi]|uniref:Isochorismatase family protein n=1 Tax=Acuticoccus mangrovi TaxID=2796142 RepID=A0A934ME92_9HYPH|nr:isochorismatase family protein [Acuticoccus mangrovi]MBJ3774133.1 isochorismatase family protein [Acuticoccus mangrovi]